MKSILAKGLVIGCLFRNFGLVDFVHGQLFAWRRFLACVKSYVPNFVVQSFSRQAKAYLFARFLSTKVL